MPGAPNRPPEAASAAPAPPAAAADPPELKLLRRLVPSHVALLQDLWKGAVPPEVLAPFDRADAAFRAGEFPAAATALDQLSIRFAEPRWPSLPDPFRRLRVPIVAPTPPQWNPDHALPAAEKEARAARRVADDQVALLDACVAWASAHGVATTDLAEAATAAHGALRGPGVPPEFYPAVDGAWRALRERLPPPRRGARAVATAPAPDEA
jgi:hypothetical protein